MREEIAGLPGPVLQENIAPDNWGPGYQFFQSLKKLLAQRGPEGATPLLRVSSHVVILLVAVGVLLLSRLELPALDLVEETPAETVEIADQSDAEPYIDSEVSSAEVFGLTREAVPITTIPDRPREGIVEHVVIAGDTLYGVAKKYGLSAETIMFANGLEKNPDLLRLGQKLIILPTDGILHTVAQKDTLASIAKAYKVTADVIVGYTANQIDAKNPQIAVGQQLLVPGGTKALPQVATVYKGAAPKKAVQPATNRMVWPTSGTLTQAYKPLHKALDIARAKGTPIKAADNGYVVVAGWSNVGYGNYIVIDHRNGIQTLYGHLSRIDVSRGDAVTRGQVIGLMGSTGNSTGPHLHFEVIKNGVKINPRSYLP